jgi:hypothetical protein
MVLIVSSLFLRSLLLFYSGPLIGPQRCRAIALLTRCSGIGVFPYSLQVCLEYQRSRTIKPRLSSQTIPIGPRTSNGYDKHTCGHHTRGCRNDAVNYMGILCIQDVHGNGGGL